MASFYAALFIYVNCFFFGPTNNPEDMHIHLHTQTCAHRKLKVWVRSKYQRFNSVIN